MYVLTGSTDARYSSPGTVGTIPVHHDACFTDTLVVAIERAHTQTSLPNPNPPFVGANLYSVYSSYPTPCRMELLYHYY